MDENNGLNNSWNPLSYSQNFCVVSQNANNVLNWQPIGGQSGADDVVSGLKQYLNANDGRKSSLTENCMPNDADNYADNCVDSLSQSLLPANNTLNALIGDNPYVKTTAPNINSSFNCGDIAVKQSHNDMALNGYKIITRRQDMASESGHNNARYASQAKQYPIRALHSAQTSQMTANNGQSSQSSKSLISTLSAIQSFNSLDMLNNEAESDANGKPLRPLRSIRSRTANPSAEPINKLNNYMDRCGEQFKMLEKERKKVENELSYAFSGQKISSANNIPIQRPPQNATRIDRLITDMSREHAKVITIIAKMEQLRGNCDLNESIHIVVQKWLESIRKLQMKRKDEMVTNHLTTTGLVGDIIVGQVSDVVAELCDTTRTVRTALWCSYITTLYDSQL